MIARLLQADPGILSVGGGAFLRADTRARIHDEGVSVWLRADLDLLWSRVRSKPTRPLLQTDDPRGTLARLLQERTPCYAQADLIADADPTYSIADMAQAVLQALATRPDVLEG